MLKKISDTLDLVKFTHTIFALPFALAAYFMATQGKLQVGLFFWVLVCLVSARTAAVRPARLGHLERQPNSAGGGARRLPSRAGAKEPVPPAVAGGAAPMPAGDAVPMPERYLTEKLSTRASDFFCPVYGAAIIPVVLGPTKSRS